MVASRVQSSEASASLSILCRTMEQVEAALDCNAKTIHVDFEDIRRA